MATAGCFACFFGSAKQGRHSALLADDTVANSAMDDYMRKGVLVLEDAADTLTTSRERLAQMGHTSNHATGTSVRKQSQSAKCPKRKCPEPDRGNSTASFDHGSAEFDAMSSTRASERTTQAGSTSLSKTASLQLSERSASLVRTPVSGQDCPALHKAWDVIMYGGDGTHEVANTRPKVPMNRGNTTLQPPPTLAEISKERDQAPGKKGSYVRDWLNAQETLAREESLCTVHSGVEDEPAPMVKTISQISVEADAVFPGRDEVQAQVRDLAREEAIRVCLNDPDMVSKMQRQRSGELPSSPKRGRERRALLEPTAEGEGTNEIFSAFRASM
eukprot:CAMPEP_0196720226 /NCGR_PEP_ID=MMETSP1091-20130531/3045_1 /TAXON_ID=302021 /ORGANISM="Rhodomonas sp., Strain CCMP768" /LENGTH=330 /DNA_ID=CAMNT_0042061383 /DNA_START=57 /DNA_END=1049 /DNA_ORIENTATION=+